MVPYAEEQGAFLLPHMFDTVGEPRNSGRQCDGSEGCEARDPCFRGLFACKMSIKRKAFERLRFLGAIGLAGALLDTWEPLPNGYKGNEWDRLDHHASQTGLSHGVSTWISSWGPLDAVLAFFASLSGTEKHQSLLISRTTDWFGWQSPPDRRDSEMGSKAGVGHRRSQRQRDGSVAGDRVALILQ